jgi:hypothetical protein
MMSVIVNGVTILYCYAECSRAECRCAEGHYAEGRGTIFVDITLRLIKYVRWWNH